MEWLNYHHLLYFWMVAKEGSIVRAGQELGLPHPTMDEDDVQKATLWMGVGMRTF